MMTSHDVNLPTVPPNIAGDRGVQDVSVLKNRQVTLECKSDAVPPPALSWLKDEAPLKVSSNRSSKTFIIQNYCSFFVYNVFSLTTLLS